MSLYQINFAVSTNEDWVDSIKLTSGDPPEAYDLAGSSFKMQLRKEVDDLTTILELSTSNSRLIIEPDPADEGILTIYLPKADVDNLDPGLYVHDLIWTMADDRIVNLAKGTLLLTLGVTR